MGAQLAHMDGKKSTRPPCSFLKSFHYMKQTFIKGALCCIFSVTETMAGAKLQVVHTAQHKSSYIANTGRLFSTVCFLVSLLQ